MLNGENGACNSRSRPENCDFADSENGDFVSQPLTIRGYMSICSTHSPVLGAVILVRFTPTLTPAALITGTMNGPCMKIVIKMIAFVVHKIRSRRPYLSGKILAPFIETHVRSYSVICCAAKIILLVKEARKSLTGISDGSSQARVKYHVHHAERNRWRILVGRPSSCAPTIPIGLF